MSKVQVIVMGAGGRMGQMILQACMAASRPEGDAAIEVVGAVEIVGHPLVGKPCGVEGVEVAVTDSLASIEGQELVVIDFTQPESTLQALALAVERGWKMVIGTTGMSPEQKAEVGRCARNVPVVMAPNMSIGVNLLLKLCEMVGAALDEEYDVEIVEAHHNQKKDAPSGTAYGLAEAVASGRGVSLAEKACFGREGLTGARPRGEIGIHALRAGDTVGDHQVIFAGPGERIELRHVAHSRQTFAQGAAKAALFLQGRQVGLYNMQHVLGL